MVKWVVLPPLGLQVRICPLGIDRSALTNDDADDKHTWTRTCVHALAIRYAQCLPIIAIDMRPTVLFAPGPPISLVGPGSPTRPQSLPPTSYTHLRNERRSGLDFANKIRCVDGSRGFSSDDLFHSALTGTDVLRTPVHCDQHDNHRRLSLERRSRSGRRHPCDGGAHCRRYKNCEKAGSILSTPAFLALTCFAASESLPHRVQSLLRLRDGCGHRVQRPSHLIQHGVSCTPFRRAGNPASSPP